MTVNTDGWNCMTSPEPVVNYSVTHTVTLQVLAGSLEESEIFLLSLSALASDVVREL